MPIDVLIMSLLSLVALVMVAVLAWGGIEFWKMEERFASIIFFLLAVIVFVILGHLIIGGWNHVQVQ